MAIRLTPGQQLDGVDAVSWNQFADTHELFENARKFQEDQPGLAASRAGLVAECVLPDTRDPFTIVGYDQPAFTIADDAEAPYRGPVSILGATPAATHSDSFAVLQSGGIAGQVVPAVVGGLTWVQVDIVDESDTTAGVVAGDAAKLRSGVAGAAIRWKESGTGTKWCVVYIAEASGSDNAGKPFKCHITQDLTAAPTPASGSSADPYVEATDAWLVWINDQVADPHTQITVRWFSRSTRPVPSAGEAYVGFGVIDSAGNYCLTAVDCETDKISYTPPGP